MEENQLGHVHGTSQSKTCSIYGIPAEGFENALQLARLLLSSWQQVYLLKEGVIAIVGGAIGGGDIFLEKVTELTLVYMAVLGFRPTILAHSYERRGLHVQTISY